MLVIYKINKNEALLSINQSINRARDIEEKREKMGEILSKRERY